MAKYLFFNVPKKKAVVKGNKVEYFSGSKAVDALMTSKWSKEVPADDDNGVTPYFPNRDAAVRMCEFLLKNDYFARGNKVQVKTKSKVESDEEEEESVTDTPKKKKKYRLLMHEVRKFVDSSEEVFVWSYEPPSSQTYLLGVLVVIGAVAATLYPLWPESSRVIIYYLSWAGIIVVGTLFILFIVRYLLFLLAWLLSMGSTYFWLFPNLNEDLGIIESFKPLYSLKRKKGKKKSRKKDSSEKDEGDKDKELATGETQDSNTGDNVQEAAETQENEKETSSRDTGRTTKKKKNQS